MTKIPEILTEAQFRSLLKLVILQSEENMSFGLETLRTRQLNSFSRECYKGSWRLSPWSGNYRQLSKQMGACHALLHPNLRLSRELLWCQHSDIGPAQ